MLFEGNQFKILTCLIAKKVWRLLQCFVCIFAIKRCHCENCTSWPWHAFWRSNIFNFNILKRWEQGPQSVRASCRFWHFPSNGVNSKIHSVTLTYFLKVQIWNVNISERIRGKAKMIEQLLYIWVFCQRMLPLWSLHLTITFTYFFI